MNNLKKALKVFNLSEPPESEEARKAFETRFNSLNQAMAMTSTAEDKDRYRLQIQELVQARDTILNHNRRNGTKPQPAQNNGAPVAPANNNGRPHPMPVQPPLPVPPQQPDQQTIPNTVIWPQPEEAKKKTPLWKGILVGFLAFAGGAGVIGAVIFLIDLARNW